MIDFFFKTIALASSGAMNRYGSENSSRHLSDRQSLAVSV
jgi:hypothetical protein